MSDPTATPTAPQNPPQEKKALEDLAVLRRDQAFVDRVMMQAQLTAREVIAEDPSTPNHPARDALARQVLVNGEYWGRTMATAASVHPAVMGHAPNQEDVDDADIELAVEESWDSYTVPGSTPPQPMGLVAPSASAPAPQASPPPPPGGEG